MSIDVKETWAMGKGFDSWTISSNIYDIAILEDVIFCHSKGSTIVDGKEVNEAWYIISPKKDVFEKGFINKNSFLEYLKKLNIDIHKLDWKTPNDLYNQFNETGCLPWIPNCK
jgi:hypothetical protein